MLVLYNFISKSLFISLILLRCCIYIYNPIQLFYFELKELLLCYISFKKP